jgi:hypothetical protein
MVFRQKYIESLFCAVISELDPDNNTKNKLYMSLCNAINNEGFNIKFSEINDLSYDFINEYNNCFKKSIQKENNVQDKDNNELEKKFKIIREINSGGFGKVFEVKNLLDNYTYALKKTYPKSKI